jgi:RNA-binding protein
MLATLSARDKRSLKSIGMTMADDCHLGKAGLSESFLKVVNDLLDRRELIKMRFDDVQGPARKEMAQELADILQAHLVNVVGRTALFYRPNLSLPREKRALSKAREFGE